MELESSSNLHQNINQRLKNGLLMCTHSNNFTVTVRCVGLDGLIFFSMLNEPVNKRTYVDLGIKFLTKIKKVLFDFD